MVQVMALMLVLMFGIFLGIDTAERNIQKIQGSEGAPRAVQITPENGRIEIAVLGNVYETEVSDEVVEETEEKKEAVQEGKAVVNQQGSWLAKTGNHTGQQVRKAARKVLESLVAMVEGESE
ncbi:uncharacterized protein DUF3679 [Desmospora activa DSM 45169]|uniref:Uncharacterized protein DUF3679 n=2 Tax=Desmospora TaxID=500614 RepID=A0A2T4ZCB5_9BACL|nr:uncharacterized protein DUF3679 [Desmospora activa DSM 45169]